MLTLWQSLGRSLDINVNAKVATSAGKAHINGTPANDGERDLKCFSRLDDVERADV